MPSPNTYKIKYKKKKKKKKKKNYFGFVGLGLVDVQNPALPQHGTGEGGVKQIDGIASLLVENWQIDSPGCPLASSSQHLPSCFWAVSILQLPKLNIRSRGLTKSGTYATISHGQFRPTSSRSKQHVEV
jgi:hypothetical protein